MKRKVVNKDLIIKIAKSKISIKAKLLKLNELNLLDVLNSYNSEQNISLQEKMFCFIYDIQPLKCACGNTLKFSIFSRGYHKFCSKTCLDKNNTFSLNYFKKEGLNNPSQNMLVKQKIKETKKVRYNNANYNNPVKIKETKRIRYNNENYNNVTKIKYSLKNKSDIQWKLSNLKRQHTCLIKYGSINYRNIDKKKQTKLLKYGCCEFNNRIKASETCESLYNVNHYWKTFDYKNRYINDPYKLLKWKQKKHETMKNNGTYSKKSKPEFRCFNILKSKFPDAIDDRKPDERYPWKVDMYVPSLDLFIEYQGHWTHGDPQYYCNEAYDSENSKHVSLVEKWKLKNTLYYQNAIKTWTIWDPRKREHVLNNSLFWLEFFTEIEFNTWIKTLDLSRNILLPKPEIVIG